MLYRRYIILLYTDNNHQQKYYIRYTLQREQERYYSYIHHCRVDVYMNLYTSYIYTFFSQIHVGKQLTRKCTYIYLNIQIHVILHTSVYTVYNNIGIHIRRKLLYDVLNCIFQIKQYIIGR